MTENKHTFQARLKPHFPPSVQLKIKLAYVLAKFGHRAQKRKELDGAGNPMRYFEHPRRVALILMDEIGLMESDPIIASLLHDSLEDCEDISPELLENSFGPIPTRYIQLLSKVPKEGYLERLMNCGDWKILLLKACDRLDNLRSLMSPQASREWQEKQLRETREDYFPLFDRMIELCTDKTRLPKVMWIRDEIRRLVEINSTILKTQTEKEKQIKQTQIHT